jgi:DNA-binding CsgD family transcriptional regulator/tetratricopeptide (TPR) repeat protein
VHVVDRLGIAGASMVSAVPLADAAMHSLLVDLLDAEVGPTLRSQVAGTGGSPLYLVELITALTDEGLVRREGGVADIDRPIMPPTLRLTILRRLMALEPEALEVTETASFLGQSFSVADLASATVLSPTEVIRRIQPALRASVLVERGDGLSFRHDLVRSALYENIPTAVRRVKHRAIADAFVEAGRPAVDIAVHMSAGAEVGDADAISWLCRAADDVGASSLDTTAGLLASAADLCSVENPLRDEILARRVEALAFTFRADEAVEEANELLSSPLSPEAEQRARLALAVALETLGKPVEAYDEVQRVLTGHELPPDATADLMALSAWMQYQNVADATDIAKDLATDAYALAEGAHAPQALMAASVVLAHVANGNGDTEAAVRFALDATRLATTVVDEQPWSLAVSASLTAAPELAAGGAFVPADRLEEALQRFDAGRRVAESRRSRSVVLHQMAITATRYLDGSWDDVLVEAETGLALAEDAPQGLLIGLGCAARVHLHRGEIADAKTCVDRGLQDLMDNGPSFGTDILIWSSALLREAEGSSDEALAMLEALWEGTEKFRFLFSTWRFIWPDLTRLALDAGREDLVPDLVRWAVEGGRRAPSVASAIGASRRIRGLGLGDADFARGAVDAYRDSPRLSEWAGACEDAATVLIDAGEAGEVAYLEEAERLFEGLGASRDLERVRLTLRSRGVRRGVRGQRRRATHGWDALTATELRVVEQVTEGLTNARIGEVLFISPRTVQTHLRNVFDKLNVSSRAELAAFAARRDG